MILVVGGGLVGSLLAIFLARRGHSVAVYDRQPDPRVRRGSAHRPSINLTLCRRGLDALDRVGLKQAVLELTVPCYGRKIHGIDSSVTDQPYGVRGEAIYSISRVALNDLLVQRAMQEPGITFHFEQKLLQLELGDSTAVFENTASGAVSKVKAEQIFGADGAYSSVRMQLQKTELFNYSQAYLDQGYRELTIPTRPDGTPALAANALHVWPRGGYMLIAFPNRDGSFTSSLHIPWQGERSHESIRNEGQLLDFLREAFPDVVELLPKDAAKEFFARPANSMLTVRCEPWSYRDRVLLIGDAAHAILPYYGQGANAGFEDCAVLDTCVERNGSDWGAAFEQFERIRRPNMNAMAELCVQHFVELRDLVGDRRHLLRRRVERKLHALFPERYQPLYSMVTFSRRSYTEALRLEREQRVIIDRILTLEGIESRLDDPASAQLFARYLDEHGRISKEYHASPAE